MHKLTGANLLVLSHNPPVAEVPVAGFPQISPNAVIGCTSLLVGDISVSDDVFIGFSNVIRADSASPFYIGYKTNITDFVTVHGQPGQHISIGGRSFAVFIEGEVSICPHSTLYGPLFVGNNTFIGPNVCIHGASIGNNCVIMSGAIICNNVKIADGRFVAPGETVRTQAQANLLPAVPARHRHLNALCVEQAYRLGKSYKLNTALTL